jgi:ABC-type transport system involved in multi-copper enzyme maturation permease subunit
MTDAASGVDPTASHAPATECGVDEPSFLTSQWASISAVIAKELRWRMRGRRAFVLVTVYVAVLGLLVFTVYQFAADTATRQFSADGELIRSDGVSAAASAAVGQAIFGVILVLQTVLTLLLAPALTSGGVSMEREKQTLELLIATPVSTLGLVLGKLVSSLAYVVLLILLSIPLMSLAFVFGGIAPDDVLRAYFMLLAAAFFVGSIGLFLSAWLKRTQLATAIALIVVFLLSFAAPLVHGYVYLSSRSFGFEQENRPPPEPMVWFSALAADIDLLCTAIPETYTITCRYSTTVVGQDLDETVPPRDVLWPRIAGAFIILGTMLTLATTQLISPSRRLRNDRAAPAPDLLPLPRLHEAPPDSVTGT